MRNPKLSRRWLSYEHSISGLSLRLSTATGSPITTSRMLRAWHTIIESYLLTSPLVGGTRCSRRGCAFRGGGGERFLKPGPNLPNVQCLLATYWFQKTIHGHHEIPLYRGPRDPPTRSAWGWEYLWKDSQVSSSVVPCGCSDRDRCLCNQLKRSSRDTTCTPDECIYFYHTIPPSTSYYRFKRGDGTWESGQHRRLKSSSLYELSTAVLAIATVYCSIRLPLRF